MTRTPHNIISPFRLTLTYLHNDVQDDEKYAKWEKEEMPGIVSAILLFVVLCAFSRRELVFNVCHFLSLQLLEIEATKNRGSKKTKKWARKATAASEITTCNRVNYWKSGEDTVLCTLFLFYTKMCF